MATYTNKIKFLADKLGTPWHDAFETYERAKSSAFMTWEDMLNKMGIDIKDWRDWSEQKGIAEGPEVVEQQLIDRIKAGCEFIAKVGGIAMAEKTLAAIKKLENVK